MFPKLQAVGSWGADTTTLLKTADMNQNESAKVDRGKGLPSARLPIVTIIAGHDKKNPVRQHNWHKLPT